ncbi:unannotated protein [freshwater metagenome]|uniref:Unannotated protein n=1 Tax=freshwater metagenome TaxID=449393 RepID=A0A6J6G2B6_9ZZZZ
MLLLFDAAEKNCVGIFALAHDGLVVADIETTGNRSDSRNFYSLLKIIGCLLRRGRDRVTSGICLGCQCPQHANENVDHELGNGNKLRGIFRHEVVCCDEPDSPLVRLTSDSPPHVHVGLDVRDVRLYLVKDCTRVWVNLPGKCESKPRVVEPFP